MDYSVFFNTVRDGEVLVMFSRVVTGRSNSMCYKCLSRTPRSAMSCLNSVRLRPKHILSSTWAVMSRGKGQGLECTQGTISGFQQRTKPTPPARAADARTA